MSITAKSNKSDIYAAYLASQERIAQLERNAEDDRRRIGVMMYEQNVAAQRIVELEAEVERLSDELAEANDDADALDDARDVIKTQAARIKLLSQKVAAQSKTAPPAQSKKPALKPEVPASELESQPVVQVTDTDRRILSAFKALPREKRQSYYDFARATVGHLGIHNIVAVREAYLAQQAA